MKQNSYILWLLPDEQLYFGRFGEPFWLVGYPLILPQQEYEDSENHKARLSVHASVKNPCPQIMSLWRSGHFDYFIPFSKMQQLRAKLWRQKDFTSLKHADTAVEIIGQGDVNCGHECSVT